MRILYEKDNVEEIKSISASECWNTGKTVDKENPDEYIVSIDGVYAGNYNIHSDVKLYKEAKKNFEEICEHFLVAGYCRASDFENFIWY